MTTIMILLWLLAPTLSPVGEKALQQTVPDMDKQEFVAAVAGKRSSMSVLAGETARQVDRALYWREVRLGIQPKPEMSIDTVGDTVIVKIWSKR